MSEQQGPGFPPPLPAYTHYPPPAGPLMWAPVAPVASMPGTVRAATIITYVCAALTVAMTFLMVMFLVFIGSFVFGAFAPNDQADLAFVLVTVVASSLAFSAAGCWFAWQAGRRKNWARVGLAICSGLTVALSLLALSPPTLIGVVGGAAVLVLLFLPESNAWYRGAD